jgi:hypothetical protein
MREQELPLPAARVAARAAAARCGEAGAGQREVGKAAGKAQEGTWHISERRGTVGTQHMAMKQRRGVGQRNRGGGAGGRRRGPICDFLKVHGLHCKD